MVLDRRNKEQSSEVGMKGELIHKDVLLSWPLLYATCYLILQYCLRIPMKTILRGKNKSTASNPHCIKICLGINSFLSLVCINRH